MNKIISIRLILLFFISFSCFACESNKDDNHAGLPDSGETELDLNIKIPAGANSWVVNDVNRNGSVINPSGINNWSQLSDIIRTYFVTETSGSLHVGLKIKSPEGTSKIRVTVDGEYKDIDISNKDYEIIEVGEFNITASGYNYIEIQGLDKEGTYIGDINEVLIGGQATNSGVAFIPTENFYFGRRGPSVHLRYELPENKDIQYFYNEITVPDGEDVIGSFYMANGHSEGYFGIQVNSETERRVLFSIWSDFVTDDPNQIPEEYKVLNLGYGEGVTVQNFGNEGSGIQSFKKFDWKANTTYKFLLKAEPAANSTDYTAYFYAPEVGDWQVIASLRKPKISKHLASLYSFLENFNPSTGFIERQAHFGNQWVYTSDNVWNELTEAEFTFDATAANGDRFDYLGGESGASFFLKNCGFFSENIDTGTALSRNSSGSAPNIDFSSLETPTLPSEPNLIDRSNWTIVDYSSQEDNDGEPGTGLAADVLDDDLNTYWHSCWNGCSAAHPHFLTVDMGEEKEISGLRFLQRQSLSRAVKGIEIQISSDNTNWTSLGSFELQNIVEGQNTEFTNSQIFRYFKVTINSAHDNQDFAAMAEIMAYIN